MVRQHLQLNGHEFEQTPGDSEGQRSLVCCSPWDQKESDMTKQLNNSSKSLLCSFSPQKMKLKPPLSDCKFQTNS